VRAATAGNPDPYVLINEKCSFMSNICFSLLKMYAQIEGEFFFFLYKISLSDA
jgi:hypothetical protein